MSELTPYLQKLFIHESLTKSDARSALEIIMKNETAEQAAAFLTVLKYRGETVQEVLGMIDAIKASSEQMKLSCATLDIVGTGGDCANTVNISTGSAILTAACGIPVLKHGNRAVSSQCGAADVLEVLGVKIDMNQQDILRCVSELNIAFLFAPIFHPALSITREIRKKIMVPTIFNLLGPLLNPAGAEYRLIGVAREENLELMSDIVMNMSEIKRAYVFHGAGLDELTTFGIAKGYFIQDGNKVAMDIDPVALGFEACTLEALQGGDKYKNAALLMEALSVLGGAVADALILNTAMALKIYGKVSSLVNGVFIAREVHASGKAKTLLDKWIKFSKKLAENYNYANNKLS